MFFRRYVYPKSRSMKADVASGLLNSGGDCTTSAKVWNHQRLRTYIFIIHLPVIRLLRPLYAYRPMVVCIDPLLKAFHSLPFYMLRIRRRGVVLRDVLRDREKGNINETIIPSRFIACNL